MDFVNFESSISVFCGPDWLVNKELDFLSFAPWMSVLFSSGVFLKNPFRFGSGEFVMSTSFIFFFFWVGSVFSSLLQRFRSPLGLSGILLSYINQTSRVGSILEYK